MIHESEIVDHALETGALRALPSAQGSLSSTTTPPTIPAAML